MKKMTKKFFAVAVVIAMLMQLLVVTALADGENGEEPNYVVGEIYTFTSAAYDALEADTEQGLEWFKVSEFYDTNANPGCGIEEHSHSEYRGECYSPAEKCANTHTKHNVENGCYVQNVCNNTHTVHSVENGCYVQNVCNNTHTVHSVENGCYAKKECPLKGCIGEHKDECYETVTTNKLQCELANLGDIGHALFSIGSNAHGYQCYQQRRLTCHQHTDECSGYIVDEEHLICTDELHKHSDDLEGCNGLHLVCETPLHVHSEELEGCNGLHFVCEEDLHVHSDEIGGCEEWMLTCDKEHQHEEECYHFYNCALIKTGANEGNNGNGWVTITVKVTCADGRGIPNAAVELKAYDWSLLAGTPNLTRNATTDSTGTVTFSISSAYKRITSISVTYNGESNSVDISGATSIGLVNWVFERNFSIQLFDEHNAETKVTKKASCTETGSKIDMCEYCAAVLGEAESIPMIEHTPVSADNGKEATCTAEGKEADTVCSVCGQTLSNGEIIPVLAHTPISANNGSAATCTAEGKDTDTVCSVCGQTLNEGAVIPVLEHIAISANNGTTETCTDPGKQPDMVCSECGNVVEEGRIILPTGHDWDEGVVTKEPTTEATGVMTYTCKNDETHTKTEVIPKLVPTPEEPEKEPENNNSSAPTEEESSAPVITPPVVQPQQPEQEVQGAVVEKPVVNETSAVTPETSEPVVTPVPTTPTTNKPDTGDRNQPMLYMMLMMIAAVGMVVVQKSTKQRKYTR